MPALATPVIIGIVAAVIVVIGIVVGVTIAFTAGGAATPTPEPVKDICNGVESSVSCMYGKDSLCIPTDWHVDAVPVDCTAEMVAALTEAVPESLWTSAINPTVGAPCALQYNCSVSVTDEGLLNAADAYFTTAPDITQQSWAYLVKLPATNTCLIQFLKSPNVNWVTDPIYDFCTSPEAPDTCDTSLQSIGYFLPKITTDLIDESSAERCTSYPPATATPSP